MTEISVSYIIFPWNLVIYNSRNICKMNVVIVCVLNNTVSFDLFRCYGHHDTFVLQTMVATVLLLL